MLLCFLLVFFSGKELCAQSKIYFGPRVAIGMRFITGNHSSNVGFGNQFGLITTIPLKKNILLQPEIDYSKKGYYHHVWGLLGTSTERMNLSYLDINVPFIIKLSPEFFFQAGLQTGILVRAENSSNSEATGFLTNAPKTNSPISDLKKYLHAWDPGALFGFGFQFASGIGLDARANFGFNDVFKTTSVLSDSNSYLNGKNLLCTFGFYYLFEYDKRNDEKMKK